MMKTDEILGPMRHPDIINWQTSVSKEGSK